MASLRRLGTQFWFACFTDPNGRRVQRSTKTADKKLAAKITARCRGKKVYDPRTALTTWSNNAALCLADFMCDTKLGMGFDFFSEINIPELIASANNCDELIPLSA